MRSPARSPWLPSVIAAAVLASACSATVATAPVRPATPAAPASTVPAQTPSTTIPKTTPTTLPPAPITPPAPPPAIVHACPLPAATPPPLGGDPVEASAELAHSLVCGSTDVVVTTTRRQASASRAARAIGAPLVYADRGAPYDPSRMGAARAWTDDPSLVVAGPHSVLPLPKPTEVLPDLAMPIEENTVPNETVRASIERTDPAATLVVVSRNRPDLGPVAAAAAEAVGAAATWAVPGDMRRRPGLAPLVEAADRRLLAGDFSKSAPWQLDVLAAGHQLPGGGQVLFPGRRLVAMYGHPHTPALGVLGEQSARDAVARAAALAEPYSTDGTPAIPTFEIIATTATSGAGTDGDYSAELSGEDLRPWVEAAGQTGYYVVLDLQPGRTHFLTQARRYEELLRLPHVGLALDPEWRLAPADIHLRGTGSVTAGEVNEVVDWLAALVREERLPQKLLVIHQFKRSMITDRSSIEMPPELAVVLQMDGQGPLGTKYDTWDLLRTADDRKWWWGWKNFVDEDLPTARPGQVLDLQPQPVFVSYQ